MIEHERRRSDDDVSPSLDSKEAKAFAYEQKIAARKCLNMLVDIKTTLSRQNKMLEAMIDRFNAIQNNNISRY